MVKTTEKRKVFLDDIREPQHTNYYTNRKEYLDDDWVIVKNYEEFVDDIKNNGVADFYSFDHDLADEHYDPDSYPQIGDEEVYDQFIEKTGYSCAKYLINYCIDNDIDPPSRVNIHTMNVVGGLNILSLFHTYTKFHEKNIEIYRYVRTKY